MSVPSLLVAIVTVCARRAVLVLLAGVLVAAGCGLLASKRLGITTDTDKLFSPSLAWRQRQVALDRAFPQRTDLLVAVIDGRVPEEVDATAAGLDQALATDHAHFRSVRRPDAGPYFNRNALLFLDRTKLTALLTRTINAQPFLGQLVADPSLRGLFAALSLLAMGVQHGQADISSFGASISAFDAVLRQAVAGHPKPLSWEQLLAGPLAKLAGRYHFVLAQPVLDYGALQPGGAATAELRAAAAKLPFVASGDVRVRITGQVALSDEEFASVAQGMLVGLIGSILLITLWLFLAARSWRIVVPIVLTLLFGLMLTVGFAAAAVGTLNLISVAFAILFVGIAVDFAIQFSLRFRDARLTVPDPIAALAETARRAGRQVLIASIATAAGFLAFVPTNFVGVAELGLIAGVGMLVAFACTVTFLPACLALFRPRAETAAVGFRFAAPLDRLVMRRRVPIIAGFAVLAVAGAVLLPSWPFDSNPLDTKNPNTEAMRTLRDLMADPLTNPDTIDILTPSVAQAAALTPRLEKLPLVANVLSLESFVPQDQAPKLALIADAQNILLPTLSAPPATAAATPADFRLAARAALAQIVPVLSKLPADSPMVGIARDLKALTAAPDSVLAATNAALTRFLPQAIGRLRDGLSASQPVTLADVPPSIARDWRLPDGQARIEVVPRPAVRTPAALRQFVAQVESVAPEAGGSAVTIVATSATILGAFRMAAIAALIAIAVILLVALRRVLDAALVLGSLLASALLTVLLARAWGMGLNYANIIALPLLLGVGVSFNIYFVMNWRAGLTHPLGSATARAVVFSALTTGTAFGSLALSAHPGTSSMGTLLLLSLFCTLATTLALLPAILSGLRPR
ncbi:MAG TPA: MMPL family transporter [Acetobacteraceae bacterium]|jgi:hypothetical protein|nr:MMPL family transporter [Acetobacteraceae bacterium]